MKKYSDYLKKCASQEFTSRNTSINSAKLPKIYQLALKQNAFKPGDVCLDVGGGKFDNFSQTLAHEHGVLNLILDPFNRSAAHNEGVLKFLETRSADLATCSNVLNVIQEDEIRRGLYETIRTSLKTGGKAFFSVYVGDRSGEAKRTGKDQFQLNRKTEAYLEEIEPFFSNVVLKGQLIVAEV